MEEGKSEKELICMANLMLTRFGQKPYLTDLGNCDHKFFVDIYQLMLGEILPGLILSTELIEDKIHNVQVVIDSLSADILGIDLSHIDAQRVVSKDKYHVGHLLEIFDGLLDFVLEELDHDEESKLEENPLNSIGEESVDSDMLADDHEILSDVFLEEFGQSYQDRALSRQPYEDKTLSTLKVKNTKTPPENARKQKAYYKERLSTEPDNGVTWKSGNQTHTISWSAEDSTETEELIKLGQSSLNSTDELIKETQNKNKNLKDNCFQKNCHDKVVTSREKEDEVLVTSFSNWTSAVSCVSSNSDSQGEVNESDQHSRRKLPPEKNKKKKSDNKYNYLPAELSELSDFSSSLYASMTDLRKRSEMTIDSLQTTNIDMGSNISTEYNDLPTLTSIGDQTLVENVEANTSDRVLKKVASSPSQIENLSETSVNINNPANKVNTLNAEKSKYANKLDLNSSPNKRKSTYPSSSSKAKNIQSNNPEKSKYTNKLDLSSSPKKDESTPPLSSNTKNIQRNNPEKSKCTDKRGLNSSPKKSKSTYPPSSKAKNIQRNLQLHAPEPETKATNMNELSERLMKLREDVRAKISMSLNSMTTDDENVTMATDKESFKENISNIADKENATQNVSYRDKKDKAKVSFAVDSDTEKCVSDSEVDYFSPQIRSKVVSSRRFAYRSPKKGILKRKKVFEDSTNVLPSKDEVTTRFEKPFIKKDERLLNVRQGLKAEDEDNRYDVERLRKRYSKQHGQMLNQKNVVKKQSNLQRKEKKQKEEILKRFAPSSCGLKTSPTNKYAAKIIGIYGAEPGEMDRSKIKGKKRSASTSPVRRRKYKSPLVLQEDDILPLMEEEFPFIYLSPHTAKMLWQKQLRQVNNLRKSAMPHKTSKIQQTIASAARKQKALAEIMKKEVEHNKRLKEIQEKKDRDTVVRRNLQERRQRSARARRYYDEYAIRNKARMLKKRTKEEKIFKDLFEDALDIQKQRIKEIRDYAREQKEKNEEKQQNEIESLENFYRDKFSVLAESIAQEKFELELRQKAQAKVLGKMRSEMRRRMEKDLTEIQSQLTNDDDAYLYRKLDADILKKEFQLATYKTSKRR